MITAIKSQYLFDCTGRDVIEDGVVLVEGNRILDAGRAADLSVPSSATVVELEDQTVLAGLIDAHTHLGETGDTVIYQVSSPGPALRALQAARNLRRDLKAGITTLRILGEDDFTDVKVKLAIEAGLIPGPRLVIATRAIHATNGHGYSGGFDGPDEIRRAVRENLRAGADLIKFMATGSVDSFGGHFCEEYTDAEIATIVEEAHRVGKRVATHAVRGPEICRCLELGVDTIEHAHMLDDRCIDLFLQKDAWMVGTLAIVLDEELLVEDMRINPAFAEVEWLPRRRAAPDNYRKAIVAGVKYASGTDGLHGQMATELERLVELDVPQKTALLSATRNAADACGVLEIVGTLEAGKHADLISVYGNPLDDITALCHVNLVMKDGRRVDHLSLE